MRDVEDPFEQCGRPGVAPQLLEYARADARQWGLRRAKILQVLGIICLGGVLSKNHFVSVMSSLAMSVFELGAVFACAMHLLRQRTRVGESCFVLVLSVGLLVLGLSLIVF